MKCVGLILALVFLSSAAVQFDNRLIQTFEDAVENGTISDSCQEALVLYVENLQATNDTWALRMLDATSKIPVGLLSLNMGELGQFAQCLATESEDGLIQGKYCLGSLPITSLLGDDIISNEVAALQEKAQHIREVSRMIVLDNSRAADSSSLLSLGISWAICLPSNCSDADVGIIFNTLLGSSSANCQTREDLSPPLTNGAIAAIVVFSLFGFFMVVSTALDLYYKFSNQEPPHIILTAFSAYSNGEKLFKMNKNSTELTCLNGIRFLSMLWVLIGHVYLTSMSLPTVNFINIIEWLDTLRSMNVVSGTIAVDTFFFLSGLLVVYSFIKAKHHGVKFNIFQFYIHRYLRLTPALAATVFFTSYLLRYIGNGPRWNSITSMEDACKKYWWTTLLYVQNYANENNNLCLQQTWYLSIDMQLYVLSPLILLPLRKYPKIGVTLMIAGILTFIIVPFCIGYINEIPGLITSIQSSNLTNYMKLYYMKTHTRAAPYFIGLLFGYVLAKIKFEGAFKIPKFNKVIVILFWAVCLSVILTCVYGGHSTLRTADYDVWANSFYLALVRPVWSLCLAGMIFACVSGYGGPINWFLSLPVYQVLNRLTYSVYLVHFPLMFAYAYSYRHGAYFDEFNLAYWFWGITIFSFIIAVVWVLAFESPIVVLEKLIISGPKKKIKSTNNGNKKDFAV